ncbi:MAG: phosphomannomutase/phosphoglucomutase [Phycisphaerales bacterium]|nr:MAG: phosphomannomutase/phosphoglucomutase [Phycisphaerales bacterium]
MAIQKSAEYNRQCPNQPKVLISDAVCAGRRRSNYPYCKGCRFNDDERGAGSRIDLPSTVYARHQQEKVRSFMLEKIFKAYDIRGTYPEMVNENVAWRIGHATSSFLHSSVRGLDRADPNASAIVVGRDMRKSSPTIAKAFIEGALSTGATVIDIGMIDTSQIYFAINHLRSCGGVQVTASHNPAQYNGFKISGAKGVPIGGETGLNDIRKIVTNLIQHDTGQRGELRTQELNAEYREFIRRFLEPPRRLKIAVDASNGMAGRWIPVVFDDIPELTLCCINMEHNGEFVHDPNPLVDANLRQLQAEVRRTKADFGVCFDGDADRLMVVDENADIVRCDLLTAVLAKQFLRKHPKSTIVYDLRSSKAVAEDIKQAGGTPRRERVGHAFMKRALADAKAPFGGELSGHFYFRDNFYCDSALLALVHVINLLTREGKSLSTLIAPVKRYAASGERNFENPEQDAAIQKLANVYKKGRIDYLDGITVQLENWWFNVRKSNTEPLLRLNLEANTPELMEQKLTEVGQYLGTPVAH